jgi:hypothetical protein
VKTGSQWAFFIKNRAGRLVGVLSHYRRNASKGVTAESAIKRATAESAIKGVTAKSAIKGVTAESAIIN